MSHIDEEASDSAAMAAEEYQVWKKNTPYLYDLVLSHALEWPSLTVQWLPSPSTNSTTTAAAANPTHPLLLGTHTSDSSPNFLLLADAFLPSSPPPPIPSLSISRRISHPSGEVNRARHMPQKPNVVATKTCGSEVHVFDVDKEEGTEGPEVVLAGHDTEGYGLDWSGRKAGWVLSGSYDNRICLWDVGVATGSGKVLDAKLVFEAHKDAVEDVAWHLENENLFGSVGDDHMLMIWDLRTSKPQHSIIAHEDEVNSLCFNQFNEYILATGSADSTVNLFDLRKLTSSLHTFASHTLAQEALLKHIKKNPMGGHMIINDLGSFKVTTRSGSVLQVEWSPDFETILASAAADKRVMIWDISRIGDEQSEEDAEDGPPELLFAHGGHTAKISEFSWSPSDPWVIASVAEDNILQIWQMAESIYRDDYSSESEGDIYAAT